MPRTSSMVSRCRAVIALALTGALATTAWATAASDPKPKAGAASMPAGPGEPTGRIPIRFYLANVRTSSAMAAPAAGRWEHAARNALDELDSTLWKEGVDGPGVGEWVELTFNRRMRITGAGIAPGPKEYNRPTALELEYDDESRVRVAVGDAMGPRRASVKPKTTKILTIRIDDLYIGRLHAETAVADIHLYGAPVPYAKPEEAILRALREFVDSGAYHTAFGDLDPALAKARLHRIEVAWHVSERGVDAFATDSEHPLAAVGRLLYELGDRGHRVLIRNAERLSRDPAEGGMEWLMKVDTFWYHAAYLNACQLGTLSTVAKGRPGAGDAVGAAWHGCTSLLVNGDVRGLTIFADRILEGGGVGVLARRSGIAAPLRLPALRWIKEALRSRYHLKVFQAAFERLRKRARGRDAALISELERAARRPPPSVEPERID